MAFRRVIIGLLCLAGLAVVLDFGAAAYSEYRVSRMLRDGSNLSADPEVTFHGFPFVAQALNDEYKNVDIRARAMRPDIPGEIMVETNLRGVHMSLRDLIDGKVQSVPVDQVEARMRIEPVELGRLFKIPDLQVFGPPADKSDGTGGSGGSGMTTAGAIILTGTIPLPDADAPVVPGTRSSGETVSVLADLRLVDDQVRITATDIYRGVGAANQGDVASSPPPVTPESDKPRVLALFTRTIDTRDLPFGIRPTKVEASGGQIVVEGRGRNVTIDLDRLQQP
ncbi:LmeA family phospholipid-binding protein [Nocardia sp. NBC_01503]|uniref:LmeA family phospholipid-binding protein n=1 Tax=Nocardia sp. NBC_01503 TaxID=2975997 RepID=UPI002E7BF2C5|nr:LmeA family phospholipid-binding protein [Nocardia sp. NBC_01503]WTL34176.1 LmeA family phospholipid-binding protein [Nocardia sp. NBC_01503]